MTRERIEEILNDAIARIFSESGVITEQVLDASIWAESDLKSVFAEHTDVLYKYINEALEECRAYAKTV